MLLSSKHMETAVEQDLLILDKRISVIRNDGKTQATHDQKRQLTPNHVPMLYITVNYLNYTRGAATNVRAGSGHIDMDVKIKKD